jgi:hypothetical protein
VIVIAKKYDPLLKEWFKLYPYKKKYGDILGRAIKRAERQQ